MEALTKWSTGLRKAWFASLTLPRSAPLGYHGVRNTGILLRTKHQHNKIEILSSHKGYEKYLVQCVVCQEIGYDPDKLQLKKINIFKNEREKTLNH